MCAARAHKARPASSWLIGGGPNFFGRVLFRRSGETARAGCRFTLGGGGDDDGACGGGGDAFGGGVCSAPGRRSRRTGRRPTPGCSQFSSSLILSYERLAERGTFVSPRRPRVNEFAARTLSARRPSHPTGGLPRPNPTDKWRRSSASRSSGLCRPARARRRRARRRAPECSARGSQPKGSAPRRTAEAR